MRHITLIISLLMVTGFSAAVVAISEVTDEWVNSCVEECGKSGAPGRRCDRGEIRFIGDQYARAMKGEPYWDRAGGKRFANQVECAEYRMSEIRAICPAAFEELKKSLR